MGYWLEILWLESLHYRIVVKGRFGGVPFLVAGGGGDVFVREILGAKCFVLFNVTCEGV
jgi:hypothetical protein